MFTYSLLADFLLDATHSEHLAETQQLLQTPIVSHYSAVKVDYPPVCNLTRLITLSRGWKL